MISNFAGIQAKVIPFRERRLSTLTRPGPLYPSLDRGRSQRPDAKVIINVGGRRFVTWKNTLKRFPQTLLGCDELAARFYDKNKDEYFIDRDPHLFRYILNYYRCGKLHRSHEDCIASFEEELEFYGITAQEIHDCCFDEDRDNHDELVRSATLETCPKKHNELEVPRCFFRARQWIWILLEGEARSGLRAVIGMAIIYIIGLFIILSIFTTVYETVPCHSDEKICKERFRVLGLLDLICIGVFTVEFVLRLCVCPDYFQFAKNPMNLIDLLSILPFYLSLLLESVVGSTDLDAFLVLRVLRIFRVFKLTRHSKRLQRFGAALVNCLVDLASLIFVLGIAIVLFASVLYFIERKAVEGKFTSIPDSMWYTIVTMITLGYGEMVPSTFLGKVVGAVCCISGVILIALPIPIMQEKDIFKKPILSVYNVDDLQAKLKQMKKEAQCSPP